jgi:hypothetical protein
MMPRNGILFAFVATLASAGVSHAQDDLSARMSMEQIANVRTGVYSAGDRINFSLDRYASRYLLRFGGDSEIYVLYADHGSLGGQVLKYDSGATALQVAGWGALTLYTDAQPSGMPAERTGDSIMPVPAQVSLADMQNAAVDEADHLSYARRVRLSFNADWPALAVDPQMRALAFDTLQNTARGIDRFTANGAARTALAAKIDTVHILTGGRPTLELRGKILNVTFNPAQGFAGRASSRGIARALGQLLSVRAAN